METAANADLHQRICQFRLWPLLSLERGRLGALLSHQKSGHFVNVSSIAGHRERRRGGAGLRCPHLTPGRRAAPSGAM